jgi:hypothetical protein
MQAAFSGQVLVWSVPHISSAWARMMRSVCGLTIAMTARNDEPVY